MGYKSATYKTLNVDFDEHDISHFLEHIGTILTLHPYLNTEEISTASLAVIRNARGKRSTCECRNAGGVSSTNILFI